MNRIFCVGVTGGYRGFQWRLLVNARCHPASSSVLLSVQNNNNLNFASKRSFSHGLYKHKTSNFKYDKNVLYSGYNAPFVINARFLSSAGSNEPKPGEGANQGSSGDKQVVPAPPSEVAVPKKTLWRRFVDELKHYWHGTKLLGYEIRISSRLVWRILQGEDLSRRERTQLVKTAGDMFRLVPFIVIVLVPFAEFALPVLLKFFPNMLPSTFEEKSTKDAKLRKNLKAKLEMAKFLQETLKESAEIDAAKSSGDVPTVHEFYKFMDKSRHRESLPSIDEIVKFSKLFEDEITLDRMSHGQLQAMCRVLDLHTVGTSQILRFQLRMKLRDLEADDKVIEKEGLHSMNEDELQAACHSRGMKSYGVSAERLREQLSEWLHLHLHRKVPASLLLFSRALYLPSDAKPAEQLTAAISQLPPAAAEEAKVTLQEKLGVKVDAKAKLELLKAEMAEIEKEKHEEKTEEAGEAELKKEGKKAPVAAFLPPPVVDKEVLIDKAPTIGYSTPASKVKDTKPIDISVEDVDALESAIEALATERNMNIDAVHLKELRSDMAELMSTLNKKKVPTPSADQPSAAQPVEEKVSKDVALTESRVNRYLQSRLSRILSRAEQVANQLDSSTTSPPFQEHEYIVHIDELLATVKRLKNVTDEARLRRIITILDENNDGFISVNEVLKVIDLLDSENVDVKDKNLREVIELIKKEDRIADSEKSK